MKTDSGELDLKALAAKLRKLIWAAQCGGPAPPETELRLHRTLALLWAAVDMAEGSAA